MTSAEVMHIDMSHTLNNLTPVGVMHSDIIDSCRSYTLSNLTPAGVIH